MIFAEDHPALAGRDCERCKVQMHDTKTGEPMVREDGTPEPRGIPPDCKGERGPACPKYLVEEMSAENCIAYSMYVTCKAIGVLPRAGGLQDQDPSMAEKFSILAMLDRYREIACRKAGMAAGMM